MVLLLRLFFYPARKHWINDPLFTFDFPCLFIPFTKVSDKFFVYKRSNFNGLFTPCYANRKTFNAFMVLKYAKVFAAIKTGPWYSKENAKYDLHILARAIIASRLGQYEIYCPRINQSKSSIPKCKQFDVNVLTKSHFSLNTGCTCRLANYTFLIWRTACYSKNYTALFFALYNNSVTLVLMATLVDKEHYPVQQYACHFDAIFDVITDFYNYECS